MKYWLGHRVTWNCVRAANLTWWQCEEAKNILSASPFNLYYRFILRLGDCCHLLVWSFIWLSNSSCQLAPDSSFFFPEISFLPLSVVYFALRVVWAPLKEECIWIMFMFMFMFCCKGCCMLSLVFQSCNPWLILSKIILDILITMVSNVADIPLGVHQYSLNHITCVIGEYRKSSSQMTQIDDVVGRRVKLNTKHL